MGSKKKKKKKLKHWLRVPGFVMKMAGLVTATAVRGWMSTLDYRAAYYDQSVDPIHGIGGPRIYVFWHENILIPLHLRGHCHLAMLLSQHGDAEILSHVAHHMGFDCVRGSSRRGGARAIWELFERSTYQHLTITPDGPRGPRRQLAQGPIYLASKLQLPLVPMGFGSDRPWRINSWDKFALPRPFARARCVVGPPLTLPPDLDRAGLDQCRLRVERLMTALTCEAEDWAADGTRKIGEVILKPGFAPRPEIAPAASLPRALQTEHQAA